jgi:hypothetical protein
MKNNKTAKDLLKEKQNMTSKEMAPPSHNGDHATRGRMVMCCG